MTNLIYIADPMCSWCYGFGPELSQLLGGLPDLGVDIVLGGLRAHNREVMDEKLKTSLLEHWRHVHDASGLPFNDAALAAAGFVYDTEPACRAVVTARLRAPDCALDVFTGIQRAFYAEGLDVTQGAVLARIAAEAMTAAGFGTDAESFLRDWSSDAAIAATHADFEQTRRWGVTGFPTLVLEHRGKLELVTMGYRKVQQLVEQMQSIVDSAD